MFVFFIIPQKVFSPEESVKSVEELHASINSVSFQQSQTFTERFKGHMRSHHYIFLIHILSCWVWAATGPTQFLPYIRKNYMSIHRFLGMVYVTSSYVSSLTGAVFSLFNSSYHSLPVAYGLLTSASIVQASMSFYNVYSAYEYITNTKIKNFNLHRRFMVRHFSLAFVQFLLAMLSLIIMSIFPSTNVNHWQMIYGISHWLSIFIMVIIGEIAVHFFTPAPAPPAETPKSK